MNKAIRKLYKPKTRWILLFIQLLLLFIPSFQFFSITTDNGTIPASMCYFYSLVFLPYLVTNLREVKFPPWVITALCIYVFALAILRIPQYGLSKNILHWAFGFYLLVVIANVGKDINKEDWLKMLEIAFSTFAITHFLFAIWNWESITLMLGDYFYGTPLGVYWAQFPSLTRGGKNLDCTWLGLGAFFVRGKKKAFYVTWCILFSFLACSRAGVLAVGLAVIWSLIYDRTYRLTPKTFKSYLVYGTVMILLLFSTGLGQAFLARNSIHIPAPAKVLHIEKDNQEPSNEEELGGDLLETEGEKDDFSIENFLSGRAAIWSIAPQVFKDNPFGYGVGNAVRIMKSKYGFKGHEDVVHNIFLQWLIDEGILGGLWYLALVFLLFLGQWKYFPQFFKDPFAAYFLTYVILGLIQFHGGEALMIFVLGIYLLLPQKEKA